MLSFCNKVYCHYWGQRTGKLPMAESISEFAKYQTGLRTALRDLVNQHGLPDRFDLPDYVIMSFIANSLAALEQVCKAEPWAAKVSK
jgi:hypothetical protein